MGCVVGGEPGRRVHRLCWSTAALIDAVVVRGDPTAWPCLRRDARARRVRRHVLSNTCSPWPDQRHFADAGDEQRPPAMVAGWARPCPRPGGEGPRVSGAADPPPAARILETCGRTMPVPAGDLARSALITAAPAEMSRRARISSRSGRNSPSGHLAGVQRSWYGLGQNSRSCARSRCPWRAVWRTHVEQRSSSCAWGGNLAAGPLSRSPGRQALKVCLTADYGRRRARL